MTNLGQHVAAGLAEERRELISRFLDAAKQRSECDREPRRRSKQRHHRSWPMFVSRGSDSSEAAGVAVALHNATDLGLAFLAVEEFDPGTMVLVRLFWHDRGCPSIPARVRHVKQMDHGFLVGCEFQLDG